MPTNKTAFSGEEEKVKVFKEHFLRMTSVSLGSWENEYELALAMGDTDAAEKEKIKVDAMRHIQQLCEEVGRKPTLDAAVGAFGSRIKEIRGVLRQRVDEARAANLKDKEIKFRIELGIYDGPVSGFLRASLRNLSEDTSKYQEFMSRE